MTARVGASGALLAGILGGWLWGSSGSGELARALRTAELRNDLLEARSDLLEARAAVLGARVSLCDADYAGMSRQLENARTFIGRAGRRFDTPGVSARPRRLAPGSFDFAPSHEPNWSTKTDWKTGLEASPRSLAAPRSCSASQAVQRTAKGNARSRCSEISPAHSAQ
jgi:hypothetical protein